MLAYDANSLRRIVPLRSHLAQEGQMDEVSRCYPLRYAVAKETRLIVVIRLLNRYARTGYGIASTSAFGDVKPNL